MNKIEKKTYRLHLAYSFIEGIVFGILSLNEFVLLKSMRGSNYEIATLIQFSVIVLLFAIFINEIVRRSTNKKKLLKRIAVLTRLPLFLLIFFPTNPFEIAQTEYHILFLTIFLIFYLASPFILPTINLFLKNSYSHENFGKLYGYASTLNKIVILFSTFLFGLLLDYDNYAFRYIYPLVGALGIISIFILTKIDYDEPKIVKFKRTFKEATKHSVSEIFRILKENKAFRHFEIGFMLYGFAWIGTMAAINIFFDEVLHLNYTSVAFYKNSYNTIAILLLPYLGKLIGNIDPRKFGIYTFVSLLLFLFFLALTEYVSYHIIIFGIKIYYSLIFAYLAYGVFAATMALLWFIGSAYFCRKEEAADYQAVHLSLTGVRGAVAPILGIAIYEIISFTGVFGIGILFLAIAIFVLTYSLKNIPKVEM